MRTPVHELKRLKREALIHKRPAELRQVVKANKKRPRATIDFETRSACDLKRRGAWLYSKDPTTEILCLAYRLPGWEHGKVKLWHMAHPEIGIAESPVPQDLFDWIESGGLVEAHNSFFEQCVWQHVAHERLGWPAINPDQYLCSASKASAHALPRDLAGALDALGLEQKKDTEGKRLLAKFSKPKKFTAKQKAELEEFGGATLVFQMDSEIKLLWAYCKQDVRAEECLSEYLDDLSPMEEQVWRITQRMNARGVTIDTELARSALVLAGKAKAAMNEELEALTGIESGSQRAAIKTWLAENENFEIADTKSKTIEWHIERNKTLSDRAKRVLTIVKEVNRTSVNKYKRMLECVDPDDDRARELLVYCGAERTGRFAGKGIQVHNLPKGRFRKSLGKDPMDDACADIKTRDLPWCQMVYGDVMNLIASCLRGALIAPKGRDLMTADYSAIEARCVLWEAEADDALEVFRQGKDIYCDMASGIYGREITKETAKPINAMGATERDFGKVAVLGLGYGMGYLKFLITLRTYNIVLTREEVRNAMGVKRLKEYEEKVRKQIFPHFLDFDDLKKFKSASREASKARRALMDEREDPKDVIHELALCKYTVDTYRKRYAEVPAMWKAQEAAAIEAIEHPGRKVKCGPVTWFMKGRFLKCRLPSGRCLNYCDAHVKTKKNAWGKSAPEIRFMGRHQKTGKWSRQATYGGKLVENITQAIARDIMAHAKIKLEADEEYDLLISVHDEIMAECDASEGDENLFAEMMADLPPQYEGCPITAEPKRYGRYRK